MLEVLIVPRPLAALSEVLTPEHAQRFRATASRAAEALAGRTMGNVSSTATGGGVAEMLHTPARLPGRRRGAHLRQHAERAEAVLGQRSPPA